MRYALLFFGLFFLIVFSAEGQEQVLKDSVTYSLADTVLANQYFSEMKEAMSERNWEVAEMKGEQARVIYEQVLGEECVQMADLWHEFGVVYQRKRLLKRALISKKKCLDIRLKIYSPDHLKIALAYNNIGNTCNYLAEYNNAILYLQKSIEIYSKISNGGNSGISLPFYNISISYSNLGHTDLAIKYAEKCLEVEIESLGLYHSYVASTYNILGSLYDEVGDYLKAKEYKRKALEIYVYNFGEKDDSVALMYNNLGHNSNLQGDYYLALEYLHKALDIRLSIHGDIHPKIAEVYINMGVSYGSLGDYNRAIELENKALIINEKEFVNNRSIVAFSYNNLGVSYKNLEKYDLALMFHQKALSIRLDIHGENHPKSALSYANISTIYLLKGDFIKADSLMRKALNIRLDLFGDSHPDVIESYNNLGIIFQVQGKHDEALDYYNTALVNSSYFSNIIREVGYEEELILSLFLIAKNYKHKYILNDKKVSVIDSAYHYTTTALAALDYQQSTLTEEGSKNFWQSENYPVYEQAISINLLKAKVDADQALYEQTFTYAEKSKAARLQAQMKAADALAFANLPDSLLTKERDLRIDITWREKQRQQLLEEEKTETDTTVLRIGSIVFDLRQQYDSLKVHLEKEYPEYFRAKYDLSTVDLAYAQDSLIEADQSLVEYFVGDSSLFLFLVQKDHFEVKEIKKDTAFEDWITDMTQAGIYGYYNAPVAAQSRRSYARSLKAYSVAASKLYETLIAPVKDQLTEKVIIVPDGVLGYLPFEALLTEEPREYDDLSAYSYLLYDHQISYSYSATLLKEMRERKHRVPAQQELLAFAPFFNGRSDTLIAQIDTTVLGSALVLKDSLGTLPLSGEETKSITQMLGGEPYYGSAATIELFRELAPLYRILHLSTHAEADDRVGDYAYLAFGWPDDAGKFTKLYARDLYNISLNADMVVLSVCETGRGKLRRGEGIVSLARAFAYAGAKSIFTTLWKVEEQATKDVVLFFYKYLQMGHSKDRALHLAKLEYLDQNKEDIRLQHPFFWASMIGIGDMNSL
ncbi:CHAT domain-containing protein [Lewinella cohaerens]|uniref:CHAT domain-containing protein n=1 Tax=Lewinella cohaerens TaxID=70995 RepID=UPI0003697A9B|nr:CHAT domain-containing tetratricopeptide repeat protein [Lewinella cohaerens]